jgi:hypothetical protein
MCSVTRCPASDAATGNACSATFRAVERQEIGRIRFARS